MRNTLFALCILSIGGFTSKVNAQQVEKNFEMGEIIRLVNAAYDVPFHSFGVKIIIEDSVVDVEVPSPSDTMIGVFRQNEDRYYFKLDSIEYVQGYMYNLAIYNADQLISVAKPVQNHPMLQLSILDSTFLEVHVDSMMIIQVDASIRVFKLKFHPESPYSDYEMRYNKNTYEVSSIIYYLKNGYEREYGASSTAKITTTFSNYSAAEFSTDYFREEKYIYKDAGGFKPKAAYAGYQILSNGDDL